MRDPDRRANWVESRLIASRLARMQAELRALARKIGDSDDLPRETALGSGDDQAGTADRHGALAGTPESADPTPARL